MVFENVSALKRRSAEIPEILEPENQSYFYPSYKRYYEKNTLKQKGLLDSYQKIIEGIKRQKEETSWIEVHEDESFILFGDLQGSFHSLVRDIEELVRLKILTDDLRVVSSNTKLIFNGNFTKFSHTNLDTLLLLFSLIKKSPDQIIALRGRLENEGMWMNFGVKEELVYRFGISPRGEIPLSQDLEDFFGSLPWAVYLFKGNQVVIISEIGLEKSLAMTSDFAEKDFYLVGAFLGVDRSSSYRCHYGVERLPPLDGADAFSLFSAPNLSNQRLIEFHHDAFCLLDVRDWKLTHFYRDVASEGGFESASFHLIDYRNQSGEILLGCTLDMSKTASVISGRLMSGMFLCLEGMDETKPHIVFLDDQYTPHLAKKNMQNFMSTYKSSLIFSPVGTPTTEAYLPEVERREVLVLFPFTGASIFRKENLDHFVHFRASYDLEAKALITHAADTLQYRRFAFFYQNDSYGKSAFEGALQALEGRDYIQWVESSYSRNNPNVEVAAKTIEDFNPEVIFFFSTIAPSMALIHALSVTSLTEVCCMGISFLTDAFRNFLSDKGISFIITRVVPNPALNNLEIVREYQEAMVKNPSIYLEDVDALEGFINVSLFKMLVDRIEGEPTKEALIQAAQSCKDLDYKGLRLDFNPATNTLFHTVWVDPGVGHWIEYSDK